MPVKAGRCKFQIRINRETGANPVRSRHCDRELQGNQALKSLGNLCFLGRHLWSGELKSGDLLAAVGSVILTVYKKRLIFVSSCFRGFSRISFFRKQKLY